MLLTDTAFADLLRLLLLLALPLAVAWFARRRDR